MQTLARIAHSLRFKLNHNIDISTQLCNQKKNLVPGMSPDILRFLPQHQKSSFFL